MRSEISMFRIHEANSEHKSCTTTYFWLPTSAGVFNTLIYSCHVAVRSETAQGCGCIVKARCIERMPLAGSTWTPAATATPNFRYVLNIPAKGSSPHGWNQCVNYEGLLLTNNLNISDPPYEIAITPRCR
jgi:hypothetical protein